MLRNISLILLFVAFAAGENIPRRFAFVDSDGIATIKDILLHEMPSSRIVNGKETQDNAFPWHVILTFDNGNETYACSGTLISSQWIVTVAHCMNGVLSVDVLMGVHNKSANEPTQVEASVINDGTNMIVHESYIPLFLANDIALIKMDVAVSFTEAIQAALLPGTNSSYVEVGDQVEVAGWGLTEGGPTDVMISALVDVITTDECDLTYPNIIRNGTICTDPVACFGDSGGPLNSEKKDGVIYGMVGFMSTEGCNSTLPNGHTRIRYYNDWITTNTDGAVIPPP